MRGKLILEEIAGTVKVNAENAPELTRIYEAAILRKLAEQGVLKEEEFHRCVDRLNLSSDSGMIAE